MEKKLYTGVLFSTFILYLTVNCLILDSATEFCNQPVSVGLTVTLSFPDGSYPFLHSCVAELGYSVDPMISVFSAPDKSDTFPPQLMVIYLKSVDIGF